MYQEIKTIEDLSLNAWPSYQMQVYDGWILRYSYFYTCRTNSVELIGSSALPLEEKIPYCEGIYRRWQTPCLFKISPVSDHLSPSLEGELMARGYRICHETDVMVRSLSDLPEVGETPLTIGNRVSYTWLQGLFDLKEMTDIHHLRVVPAMYEAIPKDVIAVYYAPEDRVLATGLGILDRDYIGIYAIHVDPSVQRRHIGHDIVATLMREGKKRGAEKAYLQVVSGNDPAIALYHSLGMEKLYDYRFRIKEV